MLAFAASPAMAQKKKKKVKAPPVIQLSEEELFRQARLEQMTNSTQRIVFIDSVVVDKSGFLKAYTISKEAGTLCKYNDLFNTPDKPYSYLHMNELGNKCYFSDKDAAGSMRLYTCDKLGKQWTEPAMLTGINSEDGYEQLDFPFIMADGTTLYFAAQGNESIGGYDIFETRFDPESGTFLKPENIGMPFNSTANDYMYAIDETEGIGWFATDRNQPENKVCIYTFINPEERHVYSEENYDNERIASLASISSIADTWGKGDERNRAMARLTKLRSGTDNQKSKQTTMAFVINDMVTYNDPLQFKADESMEMFRQLQEMKALATVLSNKTQAAREQYAHSDMTEKNKLKATILKYEKDSEDLYLQIKKMEKGIRNAENKLLNHNK